MSKNVRTTLYLVAFTTLFTCSALGAQTVKPIVSSKPVAAKEQPRTPTTAPAGTVGADYVIGADDTLQVTVWKEDKLSGTFLVRPDGMISIVLLGDIKAAGRTPMDLSHELAERFKKYVQDPNVTVTVTSATSHRIFLVGEVNHVGPVALTASMTPLQAIASAGGLTPFANQKHIYILRTVNRKQQKIAFDYKKALKGEGTGMLLKAGDTVVVP